MSLARRMKCMHCRRSSAKRGICEHDEAVIAAANEMEVTLGVGNGVFGGLDDEKDDYIETNSEGEKVSFGATLPRRIMHCEAAYSASADFYLGVAAAQIRAAKKESCPGDGTAEDLLIVYDYARDCSACGKKPLCTDSERNCDVRKRRVFVHALMHGTVEALILDLMCDNCQNLTLFDGRDAGVFAWSSQAVHSRELLDFWLY